MIYFVDYTRAVEGPARYSNCSQSGSDLVDLLRRLQNMLRPAKKILNCIARWDVRHSREIKSG